MISHRSLFTCFILLFLIIESSGKLKFVQTIFRHGNRTPILGTDAKFYPNNPYSEKDWAPLKSGEMTEIGKDKCFELGQYLKKLYGCWLDVDYRNDTVEFHSNIPDRTVTTAKLVASGLFSEQFENRLNASRRWESMPVQTIEKENAWFYKPTDEGVCRNFEKRLEIAKKTPEVAKYLKQTEPFYRMLSHYTGYNGTHRMAFILYVMLVAEADIGLKLPKWTEPIFPDGRLEEVAGMIYSIFGSTDELKQISGGLWVQKWLNDIDDFLANGNPTTRAKFYSGHDMNLGTILVTLRAMERPHVPPYSSAIMFELHEIGRQHYIRVLYKRGNTIKPLVIFNCKTKMCPLKTVKEEAAKFSAEDPRKACDPLS